MDYLKILHARYGDDIEVKVKVKDVYGNNEYKEDDGIVDISDIVMS